MLTLQIRSFITRDFLLISGTFYEITTSGMAVTESLSKENCKRYSVIKGSEWGGTISSSSSPKGCFIGIWNRVYFNTDSTSSADCSPNEKCVCKKGKLYAKPLFKLFD